jgi:IS30 family transposase
MKRRHQIYFTSEQKSEIWDRWQRGESMSSIGRGFDRESSSIYPLLSRTGGIRPAERQRSRLALTLDERELISRGIAALQSIRSIAQELYRPASTVSREISRNGGYDKYRAVDAENQAWVRALRPKYCKLSTNKLLQHVISNKLTIHWSPEQIAGWLKRKYPNEEHNQVSHETIYRSLFVQARGVLKKELMQYLRSKRTIRRSRHASLKRDGLGQIKDAVSIRERPASVEDRAVPGHRLLGDAGITCQLTGR